MVETTDTKEIIVELEYSSSTTVTIVNPGGSTFNAESEVNYASNLGISAELFTVNFDKGGASNNTAIRTEGGWRMYQHASGGNIMTVKMAEGYVIESIILEISTNKTGDDITFKVNQSSLTETGIDGNKFSNDGLGTNWRILDPVTVNSNSFSLQNVNATNVQLWVWSIKVTYKQA